MLRGPHASRLPSMKPIPLYPPNHYVIRRATAEDEPALRQLAALDSQRPLSGPALIDEIDGVPAAALWHTEGRPIADCSS
jgi:hypothetical protein